MLSSLSGIKKAVAAGVGVALMVATNIANVAGGWLPGPWLVGVNLVIGALTFFSTYVLKNKPAPKP